MKHYKELIDVETVSIDLDVLVGAVRVMSYGMPEANRNDVEYAMHNITNQLNLINHRLRDAFNVLFNNIRDEENKRETKAAVNTTKRNKV
jgi:hypothetical protein